MVALWAAEGSDKLESRLREAGVDVVVTRLRDAVEQLRELTVPLALATAESGTEPDSPPQGEVRTLVRMKTRLPLVALATAGVTLAAAIVALNFTHREKRIGQRIRRLYSAADPDFGRAMGVLLGPAIVGGNRVEVLVNGDRIFPAMLAAIQDARTSINFETYIYWSGTVGRQFADALAERARAGVKVHVLLDWVGSNKMDPAQLDEMERAGVEVRRFHQLHWYNLGRMNNRTHRKLLVVDGRVGFTGGVGIADEWAGNAQDPDHWRDTHFRVEGPVVAQMQAVFIDNWIKATGEVLHGADYFPALETGGLEPGADVQQLAARAAARACSSCTCSRSPRRSARSTCRRRTSCRTS